MRALAVSLLDRWTQILPHGLLIGSLVGAAACWASGLFAALVLVPLAYAFASLMVASWSWRPRGSRQRELQGPQILELEISPRQGDEKRAPRRFARSPSRMLDEVPRAILRGHWGAL